MNNLPVRLASNVLRIAIAAACCAASWSSWKLARADYLFKLDTENSLRSAIQLEPDAWRYYMRLSQFDDAHAVQWMERSLQLNPYNAPANIELALYAESAGNFDQAEKLMHEAFAIDHTFVTRWALANFYFRRGNDTEFWNWARSAGMMSSDGSGALFELCWRESPDPDKISQSVVGNNPTMIRQYVEFLLAKGQLPAAAKAATRMLEAGYAPTDTAQLLGTVNRLVAAGDGVSANDLWRALIASRWIRADSTPVNNAKFARIPLAVRFDWSLPGSDGLNSWTGPAGLESEFTGREPEACTVADQMVTLAPGKYSLEYSYRTSDISPNTGLRWQIVDPATNQVLAESADLSSDAPRTSTLEFSAPQGSSLLRLRLFYQRPLATVRFSGKLVVASVQIVSIP